MNALDEILAGYEKYPWMYGANNTQLCPNGAKEQWDKGIASGKAFKIFYLSKKEVYSKDEVAAEFDSSGGVEIQVLSKFIEPNTLLDIQPQLGAVRRILLQNGKISDAEIAENSGRQHAIEWLLGLGKTVRIDGGYETVK